MFDLYRCKVRVGYKFFNSNYMVVFDEDQIGSVDLKLNWEGSYVDLNTDTMVSKLMLYTSQQNTCSVVIKDPYFTSIAWPALLDVAGQTISNLEYSPGISTVLRECGKDEDPKKDGCYKYEQFNYTTYFGTSFNSTDPNEIFTTEDSASYRYKPAMLLISFWYDTPSGYTFGTDYIYMVTNASVDHGSNYPTVNLTGAGNYGVVFQNGLINMAISDKDNIEFSISEIVKKLGYEPTFCNANYDEPRKLDRKVALRNVTPDQGINKIVKEYLGGDTMHLPTKEFFRKLHICTRSDGAVGRKVFYLGKPLYESYNITAKYDQTFLGRNLEKFGSGNLVPGQQGVTTPSASRVSNYKLEELSTKDTSATIIKQTQSNPLKLDTFSGSTYTLKGPKSSIVGEWKDFKSDRDIYLTSSDAKQFFLKVTSPKNVTIETLNKVSSWYAGSWGKEEAYSPVRAEVVSNTKGTITLRSDIHLYLRGNTTNEISTFPIHVEIRNIETHAKLNNFVAKGDELGKRGEKLLLMRFYILNAGANVYIDISTMLEYAIEENVTLPGAVVAPSNVSTPVKQTVAHTLTPTQISKLKELIISGESATDRAEAANLRAESRGTISRYSGGKRGSELTVSQIMKLQSENKIYAVGWLQVIPDTLKKAVNSGAISPSARFSESTQDEIFLWILKNKRPQAYNYITGKTNDLVGAAQSLAKEWAAFGISVAESPEAELRASGVTIIPDHKRVRSVGQSLYAGVNSNKSSISPQTLQSVLKSIKSSTSASTVAQPATAPTVAQPATVGTGSAIAPAAPTPLPSGYVWPCDGLVTSLHGMRIHPISGKARMHNGIDIAESPMGNPVVAAASGEVINVYNKSANSGGKDFGIPPFTGYGNIVYIKHSNGQYTLYAHLKNNILVKKGEIVGQRQKIGEMGNSGSSTGPHLHFEIRDSNQTPINPSTIAKNTRVSEGTPIPQNFDSSGVINYSGSSVSSGASASVVPTYGVSNSGFTITTEFKGVPRALRLVPRFTTLSLISSYQEWLLSGRSNAIDPGIWVADEFFRNWIINSVSYTWRDGDLRVRLEGSSPLGVSAARLVPRWELFQEALRSQGYKDSYTDYIRAFGDLCWTDSSGYNSCEDPTLAQEVFEKMQSGATNAGSVGTSSVSTTPGQCGTDPKSIGISAQEYTDLLNMIAAEAGSSEGIIGKALVSRVILNRWIMNREKKGNNDYGRGAGKSLTHVLFAKNSSGWEFSPMGDGAFKRSKPQKELADAATAFRLSLNTEQMIANGVPKKVLAYTNFRSTRLAPDSNWVGGAYRYRGHLFSADGVSSRVDLLGLWDKYYGKCVPLTTTQSTATPSSASYKPVKASAGTWKANPNKPVESIFVIGAGHQADPECGAAGGQSARKVYKGGSSIPSSIESAMTRRALDIFIRVGKAGGFNVQKFTAQSQSRGGCEKQNPSRTKEWDRIIAASEKLGSQYYALELHFDRGDLSSSGAPLGFSGVLAPTKPEDISKIDEALGKQFGKYSNKVGLNDRGGTLLELGPADKYITDAFLKGENQGDYSQYDAEITTIANQFWSVVRSVK